MKKVYSKKLKKYIYYTKNGKRTTKEKYYRYKKIQRTKKLNRDKKTKQIKKLHQGLKHYNKLAKINKSLIKYYKELFGIKKTKDIKIEDYKKYIEQIEKRKLEPIKPVEIIEKFEEESLFETYPVELYNVFDEFLNIVYPDKMEIMTEGFGIRKKYEYNKNNITDILRDYEKLSVNYGYEGDYWRIEGTIEIINIKNKNQIKMKIN